jgi:hypothetical protein
MVNLLRPVFRGYIDIAKEKNRTVADALTNGRWIADINYNLNQELIAEYIRLSDELDNIVLVEGQEDTIRWMLTSGKRRRHLNASSLYG